GLGTFSFVRAGLASDGLRTHGPRGNRYLPWNPSSRSADLPSRLDSSRVFSTSWPKPGEPRVYPRIDRGFAVSTRLELLGRLFVQQAFGIDAVMSASDQSRPFKTRQACPLDPSERR